MSSYKQTPLKYSVQLLSKRDYSRKKLKKKLLDKEFDSQEIEETLDKLIELNYLQEDQFTDARVRGLNSKGYGPRFISQKLKEDGIEIDEHQIEALLNEQDLYVESTFELALQKKLRSTTDHMKLKSYLFNRGFSMDLIYKELPKHLNSQ
ncbi:MAG: regulatory protein RecX [Bacteriovoracaceae bacterium]|nr:regulatory protein RecX [Bacteriovoracaceae bacterium]